MKRKLSSTFIIFIMVTAFNSLTYASLPGHWLEGDWDGDGFILNLSLGIKMNTLWLGEIEYVAITGKVNQSFSPENSIVLYNPITRRVLVSWESPRIPVSHPEI